MSGLKKPHLHKPRFPSQPTSNPFDSDDEIDKKSTLKPSKKPSSEPSITPNSKTSFFDDNEIKGASNSSGYASRNKYKNDFIDSGGVDNQSVQELEHYAAYKAEETTKSVHSALKIAEDIRESATNTMLTLHQQGEQINRTHNAAANIEQDLSRVCSFYDPKMVKCYFHQIFIYLFSFIFFRERSYWEVLEAFFLGLGSRKRVRL